uniref:Uncharacterized protein n=1 Tax=Arundo donax TaxID=35708 RepID=A0A0A8Y6Y0_ARUDO
MQLKMGKFFYGLKFIKYAVGIVATTIILHYRCCMLHCYCLVKN